MSKRLDHALGWLLILILWTGYAHAQGTDGGANPPYMANPQAEIKGTRRLRK